MKLSLSRQDTLRPSGPAIAMVVVSPAAALVLIWLSVALAVKFAPSTLRTMGLVALGLWTASVYLASKGMHRLLWQNREGSAPPAWAKGLLSLVATAAWLGLLLYGIFRMFPGFFGAAGR